MTDLNRKTKPNSPYAEEIYRGGRGTGSFSKASQVIGPISRIIYNIATELLRLVGPVAAMRPVLESMFHRIILYPPPQQRTEALKALKEVRNYKTVESTNRPALKKFLEPAFVALCLWLKSYTVLMSPNKDETAVHSCSSYLHCSYSGEAGCAHVCRFWPNRVVEFGIVLSTVLRNCVLK